MAAQRRLRLHAGVLPVVDRHVTSSSVEVDENGRGANFHLHDLAGTLRGVQDAPASVDQLSELL
jgi:hypothetical protein